MTRLTSDTLLGILEIGALVVGDGSELTVGEVERRLRVSDTTVRRYVEQGWLKATRWTAGGHARIDPASVDALDEALKVPPGAARDAALEELRARNRGVNPDE